jgi:hypothetical protein
MRRSSWPSGKGVRDAQDPALLAAYLDKYPNGEFALIARARLETLQGKASERETSGGDRPNQDGEVR